MIRVVCLTCPERNITNVSWLQDAYMDYEIHLNDYKIDPGPNIYDYLYSNRIGSKSCHYGHAAIWEKYPDDNLLIIEDDAVPNNPHWQTIVKQAETLLSEYAVVSLHGRNYHKTESFKYNNQMYSRPGIISRSGEKSCFKGRWINGSLIYLRRGGLCLPEWTGIPIDLELANNYSFCVIDNSPFNHGTDGQQSIVQTKEMANSKVTGRYVVGRGYI